eukprot:scaffold39992_cov37-Cyclotella_meneghiniana.AAC.2
MSSISWYDLSQQQTTRRELRPIAAVGVSDAVVVLVVVLLLEVELEASSSAVVLVELTTLLYIY